MNKMRKITIITALLLLVCTAFQAKAQKNLVRNLPTYDDKVLHFGFIIGLNSAKLTPDFKASYSQSSDVLLIEPQRTGGFNVGAIADLRIHKRMNLRFIPSFTLTKEDVKFVFRDPGSSIPDTETKTVESAFLELPLYLKYRSNRINNGRAYILAGAKYIIDMSSEKEVDDETIFKLNDSDVALEIGFGVDIYLEYFKFAPEIRYSYGLTNLLVDDGSKYTEHIDGLYNRGLYLTLTFE